jgi:hypothetical protein
VAVSQLADGSTVDIFREGQPVIWDKPTDSDRNRLYKTMQWRQYFINLNRAIGRSVYGEFGQYLCQNWNQQHGSDQQIKSLQLYIMRERTVPRRKTRNRKRTTLAGKTVFNQLSVISYQLSVISHQLSVISY